MYQKGIFKLFCQGLVLSLFTIALPAKAVVYSVFGNINFVANGSNVSLLTGQTIRDTLTNQYAGFSVDIDTTVADTNPAANQIELRNAVTSSAIIGNTSLALSSINPCLNLDIDCRVTSSKDAFNANFDTQLISSQLHSTAALGVSGTLSFFINTSGQDLFVFARQKIIDPFDGNTTVNFSVFYNEGGNGFGSQRVNFQLANITATPVPEPSSQAMLGLGLLLLGITHQRRQRLG
ncbi:PEP-CTERM sorting domain-containing protein [Methylophilus medardicus]|uniref:PEP-CTERM sorting domain-containing protein n=1 Tax=Methylophilus medardicus TaxID=2588534 RepID=A0A5B8CS40_9PROT|nr:PEP-CTERM sorting domain-containing protein [Methylophilus medardicus]QDC43940.1 PEP-CTERM sorting domain-containing protein [Methylophilus medardicus]QDC48947.1 PEP-CTERM sorting domain-containing protein [Methylophilus medardicus]QDC52652.1 PEP-CTERM sorting domain-containing protein [Methylophilus medardicus]